MNIFIVITAFVYTIIVGHTVSSLTNVPVDGGIEIFTPALYQFIFYTFILVIALRYVIPFFSTPKIKEMMKKKQLTLKANH